jgi:putative MATE family efflux protein
MTPGIGKNLTEGKILPSLLSFAVPLILTNLLQQLYSTVDLIVISQFVGKGGTVAVSTGGEIIDFMSPLAMAFAMAGQVYIAQLAGANDKERTHEAVGTLLTLMMGLSLIGLLAAITFRAPLLNWLNCPEEAKSQAASYMTITALGMPFVFGFNAISGILRGMGESKRPLFFVAIAATANIFTDIFLVVVIPLGATGTAIATVASQAGSFWAAFYFINKHREHFGLKFNLKFFRINRNALLIILKMGIPQLIRSFSVHYSMMWVKANLNAYGLVVSATYGVGNKIEKFVQVFINGVDGAAGAMIGQNLGARKSDRVIHTLWTTFACTMVFGAINALMFLLFPKELYRLFTSDAGVINYGVVFLRIMSIGCLVTAASGCFKSIATGAGAAFLCFVIGVLDGVCRILVCLFFFYILDGGAPSYFWGAALCQGIPGLICFLYFLSGKWKTKKLLAESMRNTNKKQR